MGVIPERDLGRRGGRRVREGRREGDREMGAWARGGRGGGGVACLAAAADKQDFALCEGVHCRR